MLRASPPLTVGQASHYYRSEFSRGDYYTERESEGIVASRWHGRGAEQLGLVGRVKAEDFSHLLDGHDPSGEHVPASFEVRAGRHRKAQCVGRDDEARVVSGLARQMTSRARRTPAAL